VCGGECVVGARREAELSTHTHTHTQRVRIRTQTAIHRPRREGREQRNAFHSVCFNQMFKLNFSFIHLLNDILNDLQQVCQYCDTTNDIHDIQQQCAVDRAFVLSQLCLLQHCLFSSWEKAHRYAQIMR